MSMYLVKAYHELQQPDVDPRLPVQPQPRPGEEVRTPIHEQMIEAAGEEAAKLKLLKLRPDLNAHGTLALFAVKVY